MKKGELIQWEEALSPRGLFNKISGSAPSPESPVFRGYVIAEHSMGGKRLLVRTVWRAVGAAEAHAKTFHDEHADYKVEPIVGVMLPDNKVGIISLVCNALDDSSKEDYLRARALSKLTPEERKVLGLSD